MIEVENVNYLGKNYGKYSMYILALIITVKHFPFYVFSYFVLMSVLCLIDYSCKKIFMTLFKLQNLLTI